MPNRDSSSPISGLTRRQFLYRSALVTASAAAFQTYSQTSPGTPGSGEKLRIACVGTGGKGSSDNQHCSHEQIVALCDADERKADNARKAHPDAKFYSDWREMLEKEQKNIDAVTVSTPDHLHALVASAAIKMGKHVYCQ